MDLYTRIEAMLEQALLTHGYEIVRIQMNGKVRKTLQLMIERTDNSAITVDDCAIASRLSATILDEQDPIKDPYVLEVSSPGMERPLVKKKDFEKYISHRINVHSHIAIDGRKKLIGDLLKADEHEITLRATVSDTEEKEISISYDDIKSANLFIDFSKM